MTIAVVMTVLASASAQKQKNHNFEVGKNLDIFNNIYKHLDLMYVDTLNPKEVIGNGITAMLKSLDPYTEYYPEDREYHTYTERLVARSHKQQDIQPHDNSRGAHSCHDGQQATARLQP